MSNFEFFMIIYLIGYEAGRKSKESQNNHDSYPNVDLNPPEYDWVVNG